MYLWTFLVLVSLMIITILLIIIHDTHYFKVNQVSFHSSKISTGDRLKIVQISDLHAKQFGRHNERLIDAIVQTDSDIIAITGDLVDRHTEKLSNVLSFIDQIMSLNKPVFYVCGNHEWDNQHREMLLDELRTRNVQLLTNRCVQINSQKIPLNIVGVDDPSGGHEDPAKAFQDVNKDYYTVLLAHAPNIIEKHEELPADLILCGHTHGGQVRLPFVGAVITPGKGFFPRMDKGIYSLGLNRFLYIDCGLGTSMVPLRFMNQSQLSLIQIRGEKQTALQQNP